MTVLREKLLSGRRIALAGEVPAIVGEALTALEAQLEPLAVDELAPEEERTGEWARDRAPLDALVYFAARALDASDSGALSTALEAAWVAVREVATGALIPAQRPAKLLLVAPCPDAGPLAQAAGAALENLARTLSVEWARYGLTTAMIAPGSNTTDAELGELVGFLVSEAGTYLSGCRIELGAVQ